MTNMLNMFTISHVGIIVGTLEFVKLNLANMMYLRHKGFSARKGNGRKDEMALRRLVS